MEKIINNKIRNVICIKCIIEHRTFSTISKEVHSDLESRTRPKKYEACMYPDMEHIFNSVIYNRIFKRNHYN